MKWFRLLAMLGGVFAAGNIASIGQTICLRVTDIHDNISYFIADENLRLGKEEEDILIGSSNYDVRMKASHLKELGYIPYEVSEIREINGDCSLFRIEGEKIRVYSPGTSASTCSVYDMNGSSLASYSFCGETVIDSSSYPKGIYVIKLDEAGTFKFMSRLILR